MSQNVQVKVPASTANLGPGFDTLGMALSLYLWIEMGIADRTSIELYGDNLEGVSTDSSNLIYKVAQMVFAQAGVEHPHLTIKVRSDIPLTRGLGSSASAIIGGLAAANALIGNKLTMHELFQIATRLEDHPDNVGASLFGGIIAARWDQQEAHHIKIEPDERLEVLVIIPDYHLSTDKARKILPKEVSMKDAVHNIASVSLLVSALAAGNLEMIRYAMKDVLHQPYRAKLIPGMSKILQEATNHGALGVALSGAGPTLLALVDASNQNKEELEQFLINVLQEERIAAKTMWLKPERAGVQVLTPESADRTLFVNKSHVGGER